MSNKVIYAQVISGQESYLMDKSIQAIRNMQQENIQPVMLEIGASAQVTKIVTSEDIIAFSKVSTDVNPIHVDDDYAKKTRFGERIAHGILSASFISAVIGNKLPGPGAIYLSQSLNFKAPVMIGDTITATGTVTSQKGNKPIFVIKTVCTNQHDVVVTDGEAVVMFEPVGD